MQFMVQTEDQHTAYVEFFVRNCLTINSHVIIYFNIGQVWYHIYIFCAVLSRRRGERLLVRAAGEMFPEITFFLSSTFLFFMRIKINK